MLWGGDRVVCYGVLSCKFELSQPNRVVHALYPLVDVPYEEQRNVSDLDADVVRGHGSFGREVDEERKDQDDRCTLNIFCTDGEHERI